MELRRVAGLGGLGFVGLVGSVNLAQGAAGRPFGDHGDDGVLADSLAFYADATWIPTLLGVTLPLIWAGLAVFAVGLVAVLGRRAWPGGAAGWALLGLLGVTMQNAIFPVVVALDSAQFRLVADHGALDPALYHVHEVLFGLNSMSLAIALVGFSAAMLHRGELGRWLPGLGFAVALLLAASVTNRGSEPAAVAFEAAGALGFVLWLAFVAISSVWLLRRGTEVATAPTASVEGHQA